MDLFWDAFREAVALLLAGDPETMRVTSLSLLVSGAATALAAVVGVPLGAWLAVRRGPGQRVFVAVLNTGMGLPPVVVGLLVAMLLWRSGPFGALGLIYTPLAMIIAQWIVAMPVAAGLTRAALLLLDAELIEALRLDGALEWQVQWELIRAARAPVLVAIAAAFGRAISEVGASLMVGGNILGQTRILTTAVTLEVSRGEFARALALGLLLLLLALLVNSVLSWHDKQARHRH
jgi:tungstate transport system permease protein